MIRSTTIKVSAAILLLLMMLFFAVVSWCFFTERGSKLSLSTVKGSFENLQYEYVSGNLAHGLILNNVSWTLKNQSQITADHIELDWNPMCWRGKEFCLRKAQINQLTVALAPGKSTQNPIRLAAVNMPFSLIADQLSISRLKIEQAGIRPIELNNIEFSGSFSGTRLAADSLKLEWLWLQAEAQGQMNLHDNYPISLRGTFAHIKHREIFPLRSNFALDGDLLKANLQAKLSQPFDSSIGGELSFLTRRTPVDLQIQWNQTQLPLKSTEPFVYLRNGDMNLTGFWPDYDIAGTVETSGPTLPVAMATLNGTLNTRQVNFNPLQLQTLNGMINATGELLFTQGIEWHSALEASKVEPHRHWPLPETTLSGIALFSGRNNNGQTTLQLDAMALDGNTSDFPFKLTGGVHRSPDGSLQLNTVQIRNRDNTLTANGTLSDASEASIFFSLGDPSMFVPDLNGDLHGDFRLTGNKLSPELTGSTTSARLWYKDLLIANTKVSGKLTTAKGEVSELSVSAQSATNGEYMVRDINAKLSGSPANHHLQASFAGEPVSVQTIRMSGAIDEHRNWNGTVYKTVGDITGQHIQLEKPFDLTWVQDKQSIAVQPHCWSIVSSAVCAAKPALIGRDGTLDFTVDRFDLNTIAALLPEGIAAGGILQSKGKLRWHSFKRPRADVVTRIHNGTLTLHPPNAQKPLHLTIEPAQLLVTTQSNKISTTLQLDTDKTGPVDANIDIFLNNRRYPLRGEINLAETAVSWIRDYFPDINLSKGDVTSQIRLAGTLRDPSIEGQFRLTNGTLHSETLPIPVDNIEMDLAFAGNDITVAGKAKTNGRPLSLEGKAVLDKENWQADMHLTGDQITVKHQFLDRAVVSPKLNIKVSENKLSVNGRVSVPYADINLPRLENTGIPLSDDIVIVDAVAKDELKLVNTSRTINADIDIQLGRNVSFRGYGLDADLRGQMNVKVKPKRIPELLGEIFIDKGTYRSYGQSLIIRDGRINFVGPLEHTTLSVEAVRDTGKVLAGLRVNGSLDEPQTTLFSEPPLPEEDILPYLVLGRRINELGEASSDDSQLLANAALFMGITNGRNLTQTLAANLGIDEFMMTATGSGEDTQVQLSGRLNDRLLVRYGLGVFNSVNTLFLRYDLAEQLYLETTQGLEKAVDLFYSFEFD